MATFFSVIFTILFGYLVYALLKKVFLKGHPHQFAPLPPGPKPWLIVGNLPHLGRKPHQTLAAMAQTYGPLMHLWMGSVHVVVVASAAVAEQFLKTHDSNFANRPPNSGAKYIAYNYQDLVFAPYGPRWRMLRKICNVHLFSAKALDDFRHIRQEEVSILTHALVGAHQKTVNLAQLLNVCTTNALGRVLLGKRVFGDGGGGSDPKADEFKSMVVELMELAGVFNIGDFIPALQMFDLQGVSSKMKKLHSRFDAFLNAILEEHKVKDEDVPNKLNNNVDFLSMLISKEDNEGEGTKLTDTEIKALLLNMFTAGTDTSSSTVEWAIAELLRNPKLMSQAKNELDQVVGPDRLPTESDLLQLPFLTAIVKETFRLHPSTPLSLPRMASDDCEIDGYFIPKGSTLLVNIWAISRDPKAWTDPLVFNPERFMPGGEKANVDIRGNDFETIPFGAGRRICAGMSLGIRMVQLLTATLVHAFDWSLPDGEGAEEKLNMEEGYGLTLQRVVPLMVIPKPRLAILAYKS